MHLICCGTAAGPMTAQRAASGYLLQHEGGTLMLDCGPGSVRQAMRCGVTPAQIDAVWLSHLHLDHALDLATISYLKRYNPQWPVPALYGPPGTAVVAERYGAFIEPINFTSPFTVLEEVEPGDERESGGFVVRSEETTHAEGLRAFCRRFSAEGRSLVFSGDTGPNHGNLVELARGADILLHECYSNEALEKYCEGRPEESIRRILDVFPRTHTEVSEAARIAQEAGAVRLILTHLLEAEDPAVLEKIASEFYKGEIIVARDGLELEVSPR